MIPPKFDPNKNEKCDVTFGKKFLQSPDEIHHASLDELKKYHHEHLGTQGPTTYKKMFEKIRQHNCYYHGVNFYEIPPKRLKKLRNHAQENLVKEEGVDSNI